MTKPIDSTAFTQASLRSERYRIVGMLAVLAVITVASTTRSLLLPKKHEWEWMRLALTVLGTATAYEILMLVLVHRAERAGRPLRMWFWIINTILECSLPTFAMVGLTIFESYVGPYRALVSVPVLVYSFLIILSTLRLSPAMCVLTGLMCAVGYGCVFWFTRIHFPQYAARDVMPVETFVLYPIMLFFAGLTAAAVARQIRMHVVAALQEAETRRKLDRIEQELSTARSIQMGLLPKCPPKVNGYDIAGFSEPADQTGGDYYDWIELPDGRVIFTIADATGHGIGPALLIAACRAYFRAVAMHDDPLERITQQVDALIASDAPDGRFITAAVALLDPAKHQLSLYSAGHAPLYLYRASRDAVEMFEADQPPLGTSYVDRDSLARTITLAPGDALVLVTDGFFECTSTSGERMGIDRLGECIRQHQTADSTRIIARLRENVSEFSQDAAQSDDLTAVVIKRLASAR